MNSNSIPAPLWTVARLQGNPEGVEITKDGDYILTKVFRGYLNWTSLCFSGASESENGLISFHNVVDWFDVIMWRGISHPLAICVFLHQFHPEDIIS